MKTNLKLSYWLAAIAASVLCACTGSTVDKRKLVYDQLEVNFKANIPGEALSASDKIAIFATCTRTDATGVAMSENSPALFCPFSEGVEVNLKSVTASDAVLSYANDHNFKFSAVMPASAYNGDLKSLVADIPAVVDYSNRAKTLKTADITATGVVAPILLKLKETACHMTLSIPGNIFDINNPMLTSIEIKPFDATKFDGQLAFSASYNLVEDKLNISSRSKDIKVNFGAAGISLPEGRTDITFDVAPFKVPAGGFLLTLEETGGKTVETEILVNEGGTEYLPGELIALEVTKPGEDGIIPCTSPVEWPIGYDENDKARCVKADYVDQWPTNGVATGSATDSHVWKNLAQPQASATWITGESHPNPKNRGFEINNILNNGGVRSNYASPCVKGIWTGDGFEFVIPVKNIPAGTTVTLSLPAFGRGAPVFWNVEYFDGGKWRSNKSLQLSPDSKFQMECTWSIPHGNVQKLWGGHIMKDSITLENDIRSGYLKIRFVCADGRITTAAVSSVGNNNCYQIETCPYSGSNLFAFVNMDDVLKSVSVSWETPKEK